MADSRAINAAMADWKFYKKLSPENHPVLSNRAKVIFTSLNHVTAYFGTDNPFVQQELERLMAESRFGLTQITAEEFHRDYVDKKKALGGRPLKPLWREEVSPSKIVQDTVIASARKLEVAVIDHVPVVLPPQALPVAVDDNAKALPVHSAPPTEFKPPVAKRAKVKPKPKTVEVKL